MKNFVEMALNVCYVYQKNEALQEYSLQNLGQPIRTRAKKPQQGKFKDYHLKIVERAASRHALPSKQIFEDQVLALSQKRSDIVF